MIFFGGRFIAAAIDTNRSFFKAINNNIPRLSVLSATYFPYCISDLLSHTFITYLLLYRLLHTFHFGRGLTQQKLTHTLGVDLNNLPLIFHKFLILTEKTWLFSMRQKLICFIFLLEIIFHTK